MASALGYLGILFTMAILLAGIRISSGLLYLLEVFNDLSPSLLDLADQFEHSVFAFHYLHQTS